MKEVRSSPWSVGASIAMSASVAGFFPGTVSLFGFSFSLSLFSVLSFSNLIILLDLLILFFLSLLCALRLVLHFAKY
jgi:hypothetical protein